MFRELQQALADALVELYGPGADYAARQASALSREEMNQAWCLQARVTAEDEISLRFIGRHGADYDLNSEVSAADLVPLAVYFGQTPQFDADGLPVASGSNELVAQCDGDENTEVNSADIVPIAVNFLSRITGWRVYTGTGADQASITWNENHLPGTGVDASVTLPFNMSQDPGEVSRYSFTLALPAVPDGEELWVKVASFDGIAEGLPAILPVYSGPHQGQSCELCHNVTSYAFRGITGLCDACHATPPEDNTAAWADAPGMHAQCLMCHDQHGFVIDPPSSVCGTCHSNKLAPNHNNNDNCLACHVTPHLPFIDTTSMACIECHTNPDDNAALEWSQAPGLHNSCLFCHPGTHPDKPATPESVCGQCHSEIVDAISPTAKAQCLSCHLSEHMPDAAPSPGTCATCHATQAAELEGSAMADCSGCHQPHQFDITYTPELCQECHATPPEDESRQWADTPNQHNVCANCHTQHTFAIDQPNSVCANCHQPLIDAGHAGGSTACLSCHEHAHLPLAAAGSCQTCHAVPPEEPTAEWTDAPGQHADCAECHTGEHPSKPIPPESICSKCHTDKPNANHGGGLSTCLDCHLYSHLPEADLAQMDCQVCHPNPPEDPTAQWADAPGQHAQCLQCHAGPEHGNKPVPPESICVNCHADKLDPSHGGGLTSCLDCHFYSHLPEADITLLNCKGCHPVPPERPAKEWGDAPGQHDQCLLCHDQPNHGYAPDPTRAFCNTCHSINHGGSNACLNCHDYEHVPVMPGD